ncbi:helix-turn-helix domain-containing protein [Methylobacterium sp. Leaf100]|uniref:helix-turn-helix domain-containing protein n=1 Tax=Methylobacterium sp. Leaf100 TaxID=1736252 RepID=UPI0006F76157|nr:helix-turn-helix domain-containing protein [Methylobacterium sp. Leaf100]KQP31996.1 hypothetical protein ASF25_03445 [Methylobacterium sp. Leaf100]
MEANPAHIVDHLCFAELVRRARTSDDPRAARHYQAIWLLAQSKPLAEVAATTGFVQRWLEQLAKRYNQFGPDALGDRRRRKGTAPRLLPPDLLDKLPRTPRWASARWWDLEYAQDHSVDDSWTRVDLGLPAARLGVAAGDRLVDPGTTAEEPGSESQTTLKKLAATLAEEEARHPGRPVALFCTDEHRVDLKPITRRVWPPRGRRPTAPGRHRYEWLYVTAFAAPASGERHWYVGNGVSKPLSGPSGAVRP